MARTSVLLKGKVSSSRAIIQSAQGSAIATASKTGTPQIETWEYQINGQDVNRWTMRYRGLGKNLGPFQRDVVEGGQYTDLISGLTITMGATFADNDRGFIIVTDEELMVAACENAYITATGSTQIKAAAGKVTRLDVLFPGSPGGLVTVEFFDHASSDTNSKGKWKIAASLAPYPQQFVFDPPIDFLNGIRANVAVAVGSLNTEFNIGWA